MRRAGWGPRSSSHSAHDDARELVGGGDRSAPDDRPRDATRTSFAAEFVDQVGELAFRQRVHEIGGRGFVVVGTRHAHVERAVVAIAETAIRPVELHRRDAEVVEHAVDRPPGELVIHLVEGRPDRSEAVAEDGEPLVGEGQRARVAIDPDHPLGAGPEQRFGVPSAPSVMSTTVPARGDSSTRKRTTSVTMTGSGPLAPVALRSPTSTQLPGEDADTDRRDERERRHADQGQALSYLRAELGRLGTPWTGDRRCHVRPTSWDRAHRSGTRRRNPRCSLYVSRSQTSIRSRTPSTTTSLSMPTASRRRWDRDPPLPVELRLLGGAEEHA